jgi:hypothetical protein
VDPEVDANRRDIVLAERLIGKLEEETALTNSRVTNDQDLWSEKGREL